MSKVKLNKEMEENIKKYGNEIKSFESFAEAVRRKPGMHIGGIGNRGFLNMFREIFQNATDEMVKKSSPGTMAIVSYDETTKTSIVEDNGRGIPFGQIIRIFTSEYTSSNYEKKSGEFSSGVHGVGAKVSNALSDEFIVESYALGEARKVEFRKGVPVSEEYEIKNPGLQGTRITMVPDLSILGEVTISCNDILGLIKSIMPLTNIGNYVVFNGIQYNGNVINETITNTNSVVGILNNILKAPIIKPFYVQLETDTMKANIAFTYDSDTISDSENIISYANFTPTLGGTHVNGFMDGIIKYFKDYMNKIYLANSKKNKLTITNSDVKEGLSAVVSVAHIEPIFIGQAKDMLTNEDMYDFVKNLMVESLGEWAKANPQDLQKVCKYLKDIAEIRVKSEEGKDKIKTTYTSSKLTGLPRKYVKPTGKKGLEFIIVEGDSAIGSARNSRNRERQGLFPIRGKLPNAFTTPRQKFLSNEEVQGIISIIGGGYGKNFDINKVAWERIIFMTDADPDGKHIRVLLLKFILIYMRPLVEAGRVYLAMPPLYGAKIGGKTVYFNDRIDYVKYLQNNFCSTNEIKTLSGELLSSNEINKILYNNIDYVYDMEVLSNRYSINVNLLELLLINRNLDFKNLKDLVESKYRFLKVKSVNNTIVIEGLVDSKYQTIFFNEKLLKDAHNVIENIDKASVMYFQLNGVKASLYDLMKAFDNSSPKSIQRYKGLGEMSPKQLADSTLLPDGDRTLMQYTVESIIQEIETLKYFESNRKELVKDNKASRIDLLG